jgi:hypothetical protein
MLGMMLRRPFIVAAVALTLAVAVGGRAEAATVSPANTTFDRPAITEVPGGNYDIAWAGTDANGKVNLATVNSGGTILSKWTDNASSTYLGTGTAIAFDITFDFDFVAWTDLGRTVHVAVDTGGGIACETTRFGSSVDTPYLTTAADGTLYLTTVDSANVMHVTEVDNSDCFHEGFLGGPNTLAAGPSTTIAGNTTFDGPTLVDLTGTGTPNLWLIWAGTNSAHNINIARFTPGNSNLGTKYVETNHATTTDMGATTYVKNGASAAFFTHCGTNNVVYGQHFSGTGPQAELAIGGSCAIYTNAGFVNGGVDVTFNPHLSNVDYLFPSLANRDLTLNSFTP